MAVFETAGLDEALELANDSTSWPDRGVVTNDLAAAMRFADESEVESKINQATSGLELNVPFGGNRLSSTGTYREQGRVTHLHAYQNDLSWNVSPHNCYPYEYRAAARRLAAGLPLSRPRSHVPTPTPCAADIAANRRKTPLTLRCHPC